MQTFTSQNRLTHKADLVTKAVVNVRLVSEEVLGKNVSSIKQRLEEVQASNESLRAQIRVLQEQNDMMMLDQLRTIFNIGDFSWEVHHGELDSHRRDVEVEFWPKTWHGEQEQENTCVHLLASLVYQIIHLNRQILRHQAHLDEIVASLRRYQNVKDERDKKKALEDVASRALKMISPDKVIWMVLDRVDRCCMQVQHQSPSGRRSRQGARAILNSLSRIALQGANVKVLAIVNTTDWRVDLDDDDIGEAQEHVTIKRVCQVN